MRAITLELVRGPVRHLAASVLRVAEGGRLPGQRLLDRGGAEEDLHELPVTLVLVVPVVVVPVQPVLHGQVARAGGLAGDMRIYRRAATRVVPRAVAGIDAARLERVTGKVEVDALASLVEVFRRRCPLDD